MVYVHEVEKTGSLRVRLADPSSSILVWRLSTPWYPFLWTFPFTFNSFHLIWIAREDIIIESGGRFIEADQIRYKERQCYWITTGNVVAYNRCKYSPPPYYFPSFVFIVLYSLLIFFSFLFFSFLFFYIRINDGSWTSPDDWRQGRASRWCEDIVELNEAIWWRQYCQLLWYIF